jgi:hypothetical protein
VAKKISLDEKRQILKKTNPNIEIIQECYIDKRTKLKCRCLIDNHIWNANWRNIRKGTGCPKCNGGVKYSNKDIQDKLNELHMNIKVLSSEIKIQNNRTKTFVKCKCNIHNYSFESRMSNLFEGKNGCIHCQKEMRARENNPNWKGGITPIHNYLRNKIYQWKQDTFIKYDYKCAITGSQENLIIHHLNGFDKILQETMKELNLPLHMEISEYTDIELKSIENKCLELHYKYGLGVCLCEEEHKKFHSIFGYGNNTYMQYIKFKEIRSKEFQNKKLVQAC